MSGAITATREDLLQSPNDKKHYRLVQLANGLTALLIHDPEINNVQPDGAEPAGKPAEASDEDVDSLLSGDEEEGSGSEVGGRMPDGSLGAAGCLPRFDGG